MEASDGSVSHRMKEEPDWNSEGEHILEIKLEETLVEQRACPCSDAARSPASDDPLAAGLAYEDSNLSSATQQTKRDTIHKLDETHTGDNGDRQTDNDEDYNCDTCGKTFEQKHDLIQHIKKADTECIPIENYTYSEIKQQKQPTGNKAFWCEICEKQFRDSSDIARHRRIHTGEKPYACDVCKKQFAQLSVLNRHKRIHTNEKPFQCDDCERQFRTSSDLGKHRRIHVGAKKFNCDFCKKEFWDVKSLAIHRRLHESKMPYSCEVCKKQFAVLKYLKKHEKRIHS
ncbi:zinc finger protein 271-like [Cydia strobilella]|uniref:zinc finger protein 271-like n=1 Tax=Cydia strobilella TaxID=1100964 RepID=UPI0030046641